MQPIGFLLVPMVLGLTGIKLLSWWGEAQCLTPHLEEQMRTGLLIVLIALCSAAAYGGASDVTISNTSGTTTVTGTSLDGVSVLALDWLSNATGDAIATVSGIRGLLYRVTFNPDAGDTAPSNNYDVTLTDVDDYDLLIAGGANRSSTTTTSIACMVTSGSGYWPIIVASDLTLTVDNAGAANGGIVRLYYVP